MRWVAALARQHAVARAGAALAHAQPGDALALRATRRPEVAVHTWPGRR